MKNKKIEIDCNYFGCEPEFMMKIGLSDIKDVQLSIGHRQLSNRGSGVVRHTGYPKGIREIFGIELVGAFHENKVDARIFNKSIEYHIEQLKYNEQNIVDGKEVEKDYFIITNGNLGNNFWNIAWEGDKSQKLYCLEDEPYLKRNYSCFFVDNKLRLGIDDFRFDFGESLLDMSGKIVEDMRFVNYGQRIVKDGVVVPIEDIIEEFYDIKHVFALKDYGSRAENDISEMKKIFYDYPACFKKNMIERLGSIERSKYFHNVLGLDDDNLFVFQGYGVIEDLASILIDEGVNDAIILDNGGSCGIYASWMFPNGGWINNGSYFRPERLSVIGFEV